MPRKPPRPTVLLGPTAGGKSSLAAELAIRLGGEIINADSMQIYRHLNAGTAKPPPSMRRRVRHHLIDLVEPTERFTVADWLELADRLIAQLQARNIPPIITGGTNLYLKALLEGIFECPPHNPTVRAQLQTLDDGELRRKLESADPSAAERIHPNDRRRTIRALEVYELTGQPISRWQQQWAEPGRPARLRHNPILLGLRWPVERINHRINRRVKAMFYPDRVDPELADEVCWAGESLPDEVARLESEGMLGPQAREALGYKQLLQHFAKPSIFTLDDAFEQTKIQTRRFAKQQRTWLRRFQHVQWFDPTALDSTELVDEVVEISQQAAP